MAHPNPLVYKLNAYFAVLIITIIGSGATLIIVRVADASSMFLGGPGAAASYSAFAK